MSTALQADCVVVGAGPAGCVSALQLARAGFDVVLLDRQEFPRAKPCGDCLSPPANLLLAELGLWPAVLAQQPAALRGWRIFGPSGDSFAALFSDSVGDPRLHTGLALARSRLDAVLFSAARAAGVRTTTGWRVENVLFDAGCVNGVCGRDAQGDEWQVRAALTIGADGLRSVVRQRLGLSLRAPRLRKVALTTHASGLAGLGELGELHLARGMCVGVAPTDAQGRSCNLTLVVAADRFGRQLAGKTTDQFRSLIDGFSQLRHRVGQLELTSELLACGPFDRPVSRVVLPGVALVGDAAGYFDPFTGQGIYQALVGAQSLARAATRVLATQQTARPMYEYQRGHLQMVSGMRRVQQGIEAVCSRPGLADRCVAALARAPHAAARLLAVTGDLAPAVSLLSPVPLLSFLLGLPGALVRENAG